jgi:hypothetical protein
MAIEREELETVPEEEPEELALTYQAKRSTRSPARSSVSIRRYRAGRPGVAVAASFGLFDVCAFIPVLPYLFVGGR